MVRVVRIKASYRETNSYLVEIGKGEFICVDLGDIDFNLIDEFLDKEQGQLIGVVLTHEHADHCVGVNSFYRQNPFTLYCSEACEKNMRNPKRNYSRYTDEIETFSVDVPAHVVEDGGMLVFNDIVLEVISTPGHSPGSICIKCGNLLFSGDTLLNQTKTPLSLPDSNKEDYQASLIKLSQQVGQDTIVYPGHGESFAFSLDKMAAMER
jgi:hydroxyacylglutathione hydrolase